ncbi:PadR family transcriptional regulator PadR [Conyzicola nivalis]|uniref:PadR family transcriptional regulator PadR n=1 Tax=Conyzicola nivalis TaxID=1477021 RepID=A0ABV2QIZ4_9MICO
MQTEMREPTFWVLTVLAAGRNHGYALIAGARELSDGRVQLKVATLYAALERLSGEGLVMVDGDEVVDGRLRRYFRITNAGITALTFEVNRLEMNARQARTRLQALSGVTGLGIA